MMFCLKPQRSFSPIAARHITGRYLRNSILLHKKLSLRPFAAPGGPKNQIHVVSPTSDHEYEHPSKTFIIPSYKVRLDLGNRSIPTPTAIRSDVPPKQNGRLSLNPYQKRGKHTDQRNINSTGNVSLVSTLSMNSDVSAGTYAGNIAVMLLMFSATSTGLNVIAV